MKFIFFYLNFLLFLSFGKYSHLAHKKLHHKHRQTPKADDLKNHFGYHPLESPYGPQHQKIVYVKREEPNYLISPCDISLQPNYDACSSFSSCNLCVVSPYCGWCPSLQQCLPGNVDSSSCSNFCPNKWYFSDGFCPKILIRRRINYVNPEIAKPKVHVFTKHMGTVRKTGVIGAEETYNTISAIDEPSGEILSQDIRTEKPIYGTVEQPINFIKHDVVNLDGTPQNPKIIKYFGINNN